MTAGAREVARLIAAIAEPRRSEVRALDGLIRRTRPDLKPFVMGKMIGYGRYHYRLPSGREGDTALVALSSGKTAISLHVFAGSKDGWLVERYADRFPKADAGKSCLRFKRLSDIDEKRIAELLRAARKEGPPG